MNVTTDGIVFPARCPECHSRLTMVTTYADGERFVECEGCWTVIGDIPTGKHYAVSKNGKVWK